MEQLLGGETAASLRESAAGLFTDAGYPAPRILVDPGLQEIADAKLQFLHSYWSSLARPGALPSAKAVDPMDMREVLGSILLVDVVEGGRDFTYRVYGSLVAEKVGRDLTGKRVSEGPPAQHIREFFLLVHRFALTRKRPVLTLHEPPREVEVEGWQRLILPLIGESGEICRFLVGMVATGRRLSFPWRPAPPAKVLTCYVGPMERGASLAHRLPPPEGMPFENLDYSFILQGTAEDSHFLLSAHRTLLRFWLAEIGEGRDLPLSREIDPLRIRDALGVVLLLEPLEEGTDFVYRIYGTEVARFFGRDMTGRRIYDFPSPAVAASLVQYRAVMQNRVGLYVEHDAPRSVSAVVRWCRLILPFQGESGEIDRILVGNVPRSRHGGGQVR